MTNTQWTPSRGTGLAMLISLICTGFVTLVVNVQIYPARWQYALFYPEKTAERPYTISESIGDPRIGEPFADWMLLCAPILFVGVVLLCLPALRELRVSASDAKMVRRITLLTWTLLVLQAMACVGLVVLSQYRFPHFRDEHMLGSYLFFFSQALVVVCGEFLSRSYAQLGAEGRVLTPRYAAWRRAYVWVPIALGVSYLVFFLGKGHAPEGLRYEVYYIYTGLELLLLSSFLLYVMTFAPDMWRTWRVSRSGAYVSAESSAS
ncbi:hypothetical protein [Shimia sp. R9_3]|uniref:hypothetical protein n=1 Tax=Shimia sp. R9_3 TaxID=2821113 RepID=UPI001ADBCC85|nr:hypothetical protein [Shimia sp. R9_3]MBO9399610.1 hypothetical protein [Shimia sp. R9_3]